MHWRERSDRHGYGDMADVYELTLAQVLWRLVLICMAAATIFALGYLAGA